MRWKFLTIAFRQANRNRAQAIIKILGLAVGIAVCLMIFLVVRFETSFDGFHPGRDRIYRVVTVSTTSQGISYENGVPFPTAPTLRRDFPQLQQVASILSLGGNGQISVMDAGTVSHASQKFREESGILYAEPQFFDLFAFKWLAGDKPTALNDPNTVLLTRSMADKYFGNWQSAIGRSLMLDNSWVLKVTGVLADPPPNTDFPLKVVISYATLKNTGVKDRLTEWGAIFDQHYCFVKLPGNLSEATFDKELAGLVNKYKSAADRHESMTLLPLQDMHFDTRFDTFHNRPFSRNIIRVLSLIGLFVLIIACVNFVNLSTAQAINRSREVGMRKVLGGTRRQLLGQFMTETALLILVSAIAAVLLCEGTLPFFSDLLGIHLDPRFFYDPVVATMLLAMIIGTTLLAGFYPAVVMSGFDPATAFRNKGGVKGSSAHFLRRILVVLQFTISQALIICVLVVIGQTSYFKSAPMGFDKSSVVITHMPDNRKQDLLRQQLLQLAGVDRVSFSFASPLDPGNDWWSSVEYNHVKENEWGANLKWADSVYPDFYHMQLVAGRFYTGPDDMVVNEAFLRKLGIHDPKLAIGALVNLSGAGANGKIVGVVHDFNVASLRDSVEPVVLEPWKQTYSTINIKVATSRISAVLPAIEKLWKATYPDDVYEYKFLDESIARQYLQEDQLSALYRLFAALAVFISCLGLYSLVSFMAATRAKEVGIRKTLGASISSIVYLFSREFTVLVLIAFFIAAPVAGYLMHLWLQGYAFHFQPGPLLFAESIGLSIVIAWLSVGYRALKAALANPIKSLRTE
jgi:ABC-type antimicrobial peptide transport system permease subunit